MRTQSKSKTFHKGDDALSEILDFVMGSIETDDYTPEGTEWSGGEPGPHDPRHDLKFKYVITVTKFFEQ